MFLFIQTIQHYLHMHGSSWGTLHSIPALLNHHTMAGMPWCSTCGKEVDITCSMKVSGCAKWWYFCEQCSKDFCLLGGEGVNYGPVCRGWGWDRPDPMAKCSVYYVNDVECTDINMDDLWVAQTSVVCLHAAYFEMPGSGQSEFIASACMRHLHPRRHHMWLEVL